MSAGSVVHNFLLSDSSRPAIVCRRQTLRDRGDAKKAVRMLRKHIEQTQREVQSYFRNRSAAKAS
ncbi:MAG: hypothetical protein JWQ50_2599 [Caballeronia mineralivorans]|jgi:hypothetical protein|nr:hypothetical protein [Caballeronia mineralivorans]MEA3097291.1 hypothetical protein [Caballeronia mineralivorans]